MLKLYFLKLNLRNNSYLNILLFLIRILFFLVIFTPTTYRESKFVLVAIITMLIILSGIKLHKYVIFWSIIFILIGSFFVLFGLFNGAVGALKTSSIYVFYPFFFLLLIGVINKKKSFAVMDNSLVFLCGMISIYLLYYVGYSINFIPQYLYFPIDIGQLYASYNGFTELTSFSLISLIFLAPYCLTRLFQGVFSPINLLAVSSSTVIILLSGRRAFWLTTALSPLIYYFFSIYTRKVTIVRLFKIIIKIFLVSLFAFIMFFILLRMLNLNFESLIFQFVAAFDFSSGVDEGSNLRKLQFDYLLQEWTRSPLFGFGHGAASSLITRSDDMPWAYELSYIALLFQTGVVGVMFYGLCISWIYYQGIKVVQSASYYSDKMLASLVGMTCFLIANATNPYLASFDFMWIIFYPLAIINGYLISKEESNE